MSFLENLFLFPVRLLMKSLQILWPLILLILGIVLFVSYPYLILCFVVGFLIAPVLLRKTGIYPVDATNALQILNFKHQELQQLKEFHQLELDKLSKKYERQEHRLARKIQKLREETGLLDKNYNDILDRQPDQIMYIKPRNLKEWLKTSVLGGR